MAATALPNDSATKIRQPGRRLSIVWRSVIVLGPVAVLAAFGILSLRQDRVLMENDVRERSRLFAEEAVNRCWTALTEIPPGTRDPFASSFDPGGPVDPSLRGFGISAGGALIAPADYPRVPRPPLALAGMTTNRSARELEFWTRLQSNPGTTAPASSHVQGLKEFLERFPESPLRGLAHYRLGLELLDQDVDQAANQFRILLDQFPSALGETGLPLAPLAFLELAKCAALKGGETSGGSAELQLVCSNAVYHPSFLTSWILDEAARLSDAGDAGAVLRWKKLWKSQESNRFAYSAAARAIGRDDTEDSSDPSSNIPIDWPGTFWFSMETGGSASSWLAITARTNQADGSRLIFCRSEADVFARVKSLRDAARILPPFMGVYYEIGGRTFSGRFPAAGELDGVGGFEGTLDGGSSLFNSSPSMALVSHEAAPIRVHMLLIDPPMMYGRQQQRLLLFGGLIVVSALIALAGLCSILVGLRRQQRLYQFQSNFISSVTHELRAPISAVRLMAENFKDGKIPGSDHQRFFRYMVQECSRLTTMIENVLSVARIEQGRDSYDFQPTDVAAILEDTVRLMQPGAGERQVDLRLAPNAEASPALQTEIVLDGRALQQALINLVDNAIKHSPAEGMVTVGMEVFTGSGPGGESKGPADYPWLRIWVQDQGPGVPEEEKDRIFERFYRRGSELRRETPGVGIGLTIVKHVAEAHGGRVFVQTESGKGSRFILELPGVPDRGIKNTK